MSSLRESRYVEAAPERVLAVVRDIAAYPSWHDEMKRVEVRELDADGRPQLAELTAAALGLTTRYTIRISYPSPSEIRTSLVRGDLISRQEQRFTVRESATGCALDYALDIVTRVPLPGLLVRGLMAGSVQGLLDGIKARAER
jgi:ribosome-associated toxin RatA of RatAB toxin-antitoxin module